MSLFKKYACLYGNLEFTESEAAEIGDFVAGVVKCASTNAANAWKTVLHRHFDYVPDTAFEKIARYCEYIGVVDGEDDPRIREALLGEDGLDKEALFGRGAKSAPTAVPPALDLSATSKAAKGGFMQKGLLPALGLGVVALPLIMSGLANFNRTSGLKRSLVQVMKDHPELRNDPNAGRYFQAIADFAPAVATNSLLAGNVMKQLHQIGPAALTPAMIKDLLGVQETVSKLRQPSQGQIKDIGESMISAGGIYAKD